MFRQFVLATALLACVSARAETVTASWYGPGFDGRRAASGCVYDQWALTAASPSLPLGTVLSVTHNGRSVRVVINDRGPYIRGRDLDLSRAAAERLAMVGVGVARVSVRVVGVTRLSCRGLPAPRTAVGQTG